MRVALLLLALALPAFGQVTSQSGSNAQSGSASQSYSAGGNSAASSGAANVGNAQNITFNSAPELESRTLRTVAQVYAPAIGVSAPCLIATSGGLTGVGFGIALGTNTEDPGCTLRETSRLLYAIGQPLAAARVMCSNPAAKLALGEEICAPPPLPMPEACYSDPALAARARLPVCR